MFTFKPDALAMCKNRLDYDEDEDSFFIDSMLDISIGKTIDEIVVYRPFYVAAKELEQRFTNNLQEADGVKFLQYEKQIASLLALQVSLDLADSLTITDSFSAVLALADANNTSLNQQVKDTTAYSNCAIFAF